MQSASRSAAHQSYCHRLIDHFIPTKLISSFPLQTVAVLADGIEGKTSPTGLQYVRVVGGRRPDEVELRQLHVLSYCDIALSVPSVHHVVRRVANCNKNKLCYMLRQNPFYKK